MPYALRYLLLSLLTMALLGVLYPLAMVGVGKLIAPHAAAGKPIYRGEVLVGYENIGQAFTSDRYIWGRPSAVDYDASATGGSNYGNQHPDLLAAMESRAETLLAAHPGLTREEIPVELLTASGSGLDPHITERAALLQAGRVAGARGLDPQDVAQLIHEQRQTALLGLFGPDGVVNVLQLNLALDALDQSVGAQ
ncbi:K+-transporting ATPase ATPase C chain [Neolewinella xylanilytica]|uniref:Potassium-transporting ATPase KdpC subunit n=1 Tax=Neolewinella xylanilytica TaxID=1514080 RepID=A0A2S6I4F7_9BACT|nr:potassium-transporting ATPase subunit KdpC [Neolewinella xylanilytica]PPK86044.1 K+-transporting ATPase ATPase C chain [Neolewinella xylanilytica]